MYNQSARNSIRTTFALVAALSVLLTISCDQLSASNDKSNVVVVGQDPENEIMNSFSQGLNRSRALYRHLAEGDRLRKAGLYDKAQIEYQILIDGIDGKKDTFMGHLGLLDLYEDMGDYGRAVVQCDWILKHSADHAKPMFKERLQRLKKLYNNSDNKTQVHILSSDQEVTKDSEDTIPNSS